MNQKKKKNQNTYRQKLKSKHFDKQGRGKTKNNKHNFKKIDIPEKYNYIYSQKSKTMLPTN